MEHLFGIDLGGTKIEGIIINRVTHKVISRIRIPTEANKGYTHILSRIELLVRKLTTESNLSPIRIGIGTPGILDPDTQTIKNSNTSCLNGKPLKLDLESKLQCPIIMANDANCFALAETRMGIIQNKLRGASVIFGIILGTGVGGGLVVDNHVIDGRHGIAGEWGHNFLDESGGPCYCGKIGCVETILSGPGLEQYYLMHSGTHKPLIEITQRATSGIDPVAIETIKRLTFFFGKAMAQVINILDPHAIVIGGGVGNIQAIYEQGLLEIKKHIFNNQVTTPLLPPLLGDSAGVFGAALLTA